MITKVNNIQSVGIGYKYPTEFFGLSTDTKPTDTANGSVFTEIDSGKKYMFDFAGGQWCEIPASGGSSLPEVTADDNGDVLTVVDGAWAKAAPSGGGVLVVHINWTDSAATMDKTWQEIVDADGAVVIVSPYDEGGYETYILMSIGGGTGGSARIVIVHNSYDSPDSSMTFIADSASSYPSAAI